MKVLALDSALDAVSAAALVQGGAQGERIAIASEPGSTGHAERLMDLIADVLTRTALKAGDLDRIAVTIGPGSFTGVRIALSAARGLGLALKIPVVGLSTLAVMAAAARGETGRPVTAAIDARRGLVYTQSFNAAGLAVEAPALKTIEAAALSVAPSAILAGSGAALVAAFCQVPFDRDPGDPGDPAAPPLDITVLARLGAAVTPGEHPPEPLYLRAPDATPPSAAKRVARRG